MKVAICFSGQLREIHKSFDYWKKIIDRYEMDVYGSFWKGIDEENDSEIPTKEELFYKLNPVKCEWECQKSFDKFLVQVFSEEIIETFPPHAPWPLNTSFLEDNKKPRFFPMWYKVMRVNLLAQAKEYDIVIRAREDIYLEPFPELEINDYFNIPWGSVFNDKWLNNFGPPDQFCFASQENMNYYSSLFIYLSRYLKEGQYFFPPENVLKSHLSNFKIKMWQFPSRIHYFKNDHCFNSAWGVESGYFSDPFDYPKELDPLYSFYRNRYTN